MINNLSFDNLVSIRPQSDPSNAVYCVGGDGTFNVPMHLSQYREDPAFYFNVQFVPGGKCLLYSPSLRQMATVFRQGCLNIFQDYEEGNLAQEWLIVPSFLDPGSGFLITSAKSPCSSWTAGLGIVSSSEDWGSWLTPESSTNRWQFWPVEG